MFLIVSMSAPSCFVPPFPLFIILHQHTLRNNICELCMSVEGHPMLEESAKWGRFCFAHFRNIGIKASTSHTPIGCHLRRCCVSFGDAALTWFGLVSNYMLTYASIDSYPWRILQNQQKSPEEVNAHQVHSTAPTVESWASQISEHYLIISA